MIRSNRFARIFGIALPLVVTLFVAASTGAQELKKKTLAICEINPIPALMERVQRDGKKNELDGVVQSLDSKLIFKMETTGKFAIQAHSALPAILRGGAFDAGTMKDKLDLDYVLVVTINDFGDERASGDNNVVYRNVRLSGVAQIYNIRTSGLVKPASIEINPEDLARLRGGDISDKLLDLASDMMSDGIARYVASEIYPPKVEDVSGTQVTIGWGKGMPIANGEVWEVWASKGNVTNDVGVVKAILQQVGQVKIRRVDSDDSTGEITGEDRGIKQDCILRKPQ
jgi:hypothetical protein